MLSTRIELQPEQRVGFLTDKFNAFANRIRSGEIMRLVDIQVVSHQLHGFIDDGLLPDMKDLYRSHYERMLSHAVVVLDEHMEYEDGSQRWLIELRAVLRHIEGVLWDLEREDFYEQPIDDRP